MICKCLLDDRVISYDTLVDTDTYNVPADLEIYRYINIAQMLYLLEKRNLFFCNVSNWEDPHERGKFPEFGPAYGDLFSMRFAAYGSSWTSTRESDGMWRAYSPDKQGLRVKTTVAKLKQALSNVKCDAGKSYLKDMSFLWFLGRVLYSDPPKLHRGYTRHPTVCDTYKYYFHKRSEFSYENEVRAIILPFSCVEERFVPHIARDINLSCAVDLSDFIAEITVDSRAPNWVVDCISDYCSHVGVRVEQSTLYS